MTREQFLESTIDVIDLRTYLEQDSNFRLTTFILEDVALFVKDDKVCLSHFEAIEFLSEDGKIEVDAVKKETTKKVDANGVTHFTIPLFPTHRVIFSNDEILSIPRTQMKAKDFFTKRDYNWRCQDNFKYLLTFLNENGFID